ncbi:MAG: hypothetical protein LC739_08715 [Actinobacteria bacterium]|nr:hypothetical protein [Actinomycetota bacterium]
MCAAFLVMGSACAQENVVYGSGRPPWRRLARTVDDQAAFADGARTAEIPFACAAGGGGPSRQWQLCLAHSNGITAFLTWGDAEGLTAHVTGTGLENAVVISLDANDFTGIRRVGGSISVSIEKCWRNHRVAGLRRLAVILLADIQEPSRQGLKEEVVMPSLPDHRDLDQLRTKEVT